MRAFAQALGLASGIALAALACGDESLPPLAPTSGPALVHSGLPDITGLILGPDGTSICNFVAEATQLRVGIIDAVNQVAVGVQELSCPEYEYAVPVTPGTYYIRTLFLTSDGIGQFPVRTLVTPPVSVQSADVLQDIVLEAGLPLGGSVTLDGRPVEGVTFALAYAALPGFGAAFGVSTADGGWADNGGRSPLMLQPNLEYQFLTGCPPLLGTRVATNFPPGSFSFPTGVNEANCTLLTGDLARFTHNFNRVVATSLPGDIGGLSQEIFGGLGSGYGVQFPVSAGASLPKGSIETSELFLGGLLIGLESDVVLSGVDVGGDLACGAACRDFGPAGIGSIAHSRAHGRTITWRYSDTGSPEGVGLSVTQRSFDAPAGKDYVLFQFTIQNSGQHPRRLGLGILADWDVGASGFGDVGIVEQGGRLMYQVDDGESTRHAGTLMQGDAPANQGFYFLGSTGTSLQLSDQVAVLQGSLSAPPVGPGDLRYIQSVGPIDLRPGEATALWVATVLGEDEAAFKRNAEAASADIVVRRRFPVPVAAAAPVVGATIQLGEMALPTRANACKKGCETKR
jgi:hypothetical protein